ncbi:Heme A synthase, cytochrome oxidase biogenesis protein Cox15-CtaA [Lunatimonas lonarensis]|uniref:Heme A synthase, cytochrome oxidase biogenesis protein Cox15-CtaA n=1 Tax=Lunatimonas lonarensis TaxID=1232681 RepID=R7ZLK1_9BACT|nr:COX15/CtaA family protein [Lunatimonas lonarensis]EON74914.1 Heme A synthase, cytochrome oxidase biogenesis protein Cox15-CtaA [Lunatimonas lonarensis]
MNYRGAVYTWLITGCVMVLMMVVVGGITRLTQSGLSMVRWEPIIGTLPPLTEEKWQQEFEAYQATPEYKVYNNHFSLDDFKGIYFWEYVHRLLGRIVGLVFLIPAIFFWRKGAFDGRMKKQVVIIFFGGLFQGVLGWYMVKSGLVDRPHVSHFRLAAHLSTALALAAYIFWVSLEWKPFKQIHAPEIRKWSIGLLVVLGIQIVYGAFVAGLKAGKMYNTFPKMGRTWFPNEITTAFDIHGWMAVIENGIPIQLIHRYLAYLVVGMVVWVAWSIYKKHKGLQPAALLLVALVTVQFLLGVFTLLYAVPVSLGVLHQLGAVFLLLGVIYLIKKTSRVTGNKATKPAEATQALAY